MKRLLATSLLLLLIFLSFIPLVFSLDTYTLIITVVDEKDNPLSGAWIKVTTKYGENDYRSPFPKQTNASGVVEFTVQSIEPLANVTVGWLGIEVARETVNLSGSVTSVTIICGLNDLSVLATDGNGLPLRGANVELRWVTDMPYTLKGPTDDQGLAVFPQMPYYSYQVSTCWQGKLVHEGTFYFTSSTTTYVAECKVYDLTVNVVDREDRPISEANVTVTRSDEWETSKKTDNGVAAFTQLATENYSVEASFLSSSNTTTINLLEDTEVFLKLNISVLRIFEVTVEVMWSDEKPVLDANIVIRNNNGQALKNGVTNANGIFTASLIKAEYIIEVSRRTLNDAKNVTIDSETTIPFVFDASLRTYTLTVTVTGYDGSLVNRALVEVNLNGVTVSNSETTGGKASFELKDGVYKIVVTWDDEREEKTVELTEDRELSMTFQKEIPFDWILYILAISAASATLCLLALYLRRRRQRMITFPYIPESAETS